MITTENLTKIFSLGKNTPPNTAVDSLSIDVNEGEVFGFLGPNGAGKTTTLRMLTSLIAPTFRPRHDRWYGTWQNDTQIRRTVGILTETPGMLRSPECLEKPDDLCQAVWG